MPLDLGELQDNRAPLAIAYAGTVLNIVYLPERVDNQWVRRFKKLRKLDPEDEETDRAMLDLMVEMLAEWDLTDRGVPMAVTEENLSRLPLRLLKLVLESVFTDIGAFVGQGEESKNGQTSLPISSLAG